MSASQSWSIPAGKHSTYTGGAGVTGWNSVRVVPTYSSFRNKANPSLRHLLQMSLTQLQAQLAPFEGSFLKSLTKHCQGNRDRQLGTLVSTGWQNNKLLGAVSGNTFCDIALILCDNIFMFIETQAQCCCLASSGKGRTIWIFGPFLHLEPWCYWSDKWDLIYKRAEAKAQEILLKDGSWGWSPQPYL